MRRTTAIAAKLVQGKSGEALFFEIALEDLGRAADLFRPIYDRTFAGRAGRPNLMIKIPGTAEGLPAIEEAIYAGIPINLTLLFSREHYFGATEAFLRGIERRIEAGLTPDVASVASVFVSRWDAAVAGTALTA